MSILKLTKLVHSCVLVELDGLTVLFDPGNYSLESGVLNLANLTKLDVLVITHEHQDHFEDAFVFELIKKFPKVKIITTDSVKTLISEKIQNSLDFSLPSNFSLFKSKHESLPFGVNGPQNIGVSVSGLFSHPGDSNSFDCKTKILAMPMTAPWGSMVESINKVTELKPEYVLPIHDWQWRPEAISKFYDRFKTEFSKRGIQFIIPTDGEAIEIVL